MSSGRVPARSTVSVCDKLPDKILEKTIGFSTEIEDQEVSYIQSRIPSNDHYEITKLLHKNFPISKERQIVKKRAYRKGRQKRQTGCQLTSTRRRELGLHKLSRSGLKFTDLLPIHAIWVDYMRTYLGLDEFSKKKWDSLMESDELNQQLWKADYHGAYISVIRSLCPSFVGLEGILVMETRNVFKIVSKDDITRTVPKMSSEFQVKIGKLKLKFLGKNFITRPAERAKKFRSTINTDL